MTEEDARSLQRDINRAAVAGVVHVLIVIFVVAALAQHAGGFMEFAYAGPNVRAALTGPPVSIGVSMVATTIVLASRFSRRAWVVPLISAGLGIAWVAVWALVGAATP